MLGGCSSTVEGAAFPVDSIGMFDPCEVLTDGNLRDLGADPNTQKADVLNTHFPGFNLCSWEGQWFSLGLTSTKYSLQEVEVNPQFRDFRNIEVLGRNLLMFKDHDDASDSSCLVAFATSRSTAMISIDAYFRAERPETPCALVEQAAQVVIPLLP
ncbi:DUF3558 domain-containing protein [Rhodococcus sp. 24CO]|uniref:DUF3558 domain-containing protein n=1 Tax=Rhodococcus sp. 24CO TaxID=3117460 RepID=UPI003D329F1D